MAIIAKMRYMAELVVNIDAAYEPCKLEDSPIPFWFELAYQYECNCIEDTTTGYL